MTVRLGCVSNRRDYTPKSHDATPDAAPVAGVDTRGVVGGED